MGNLLVYSLKMSIVDGRFGWLGMDHAKTRHQLEPRTKPNMPFPQHTSDTAPASELVPDVTRKFVRLKDERADGTVIFDFAIGWPDLSVELMMPRAAFEEFCTTHRVERLGH